jgi:hypothetical protein
MRGGLLEEWSMLRSVALAVTASLAIAGGAQAAVITESAAFNHFQPLALIVQTNPGQRTFLSTARGAELSQATHFGGFDPSLGTLTGAQLTVTSSQVFRMAMLGEPEVPQSSFIATANYDYAYQSQVLLNGVQASASRSYHNPMGAFLCFSTCYLDSTGFQTVNVVASLFDLGGLSAPGGFDVTTNSIIDLELDAAMQGYLGQTSSLAWMGTLAMTYTYRPADAVPEPATWALLIGGFGAVGASLRRRGTTRRCRPA